jgi:hypothetical protein
METLKLKTLTILLMITVSVFGNPVYPINIDSNSDNSEATELVLFYGKSNYFGNVITWVSEFELENDRYILEKSSDGSEFSEVSSVIQENKSLQSYSASDCTPSTVTYYRIKRMSFDGGEYTSEIIAIRNTSKEKE